MEQVVVLAFYSYMDCAGVIVVLHISDHSPCKFSIRIQPLFVLFHDKTALVARQIEQRKFLELQKSSMVNASGHADISLFVRSSVTYPVPVICGVLAFFPEDFRKTLRKLSGVVHPFRLLFRSVLLVLFVSLLLHVAVHIYII